VSKPPRASKQPNYSRKLARRIRLADGRTLTTLHDAREVVLSAFGAVNSRSGALDYAIKLLMQAAENGKRADILAATDALEMVLRGRRLLR
jgi:hypothetical protein